MSFLLEKKKKSIIISYYHIIICKCPQSPKILRYKLFHDIILQKIIKIIDMD